MAKGLNRVELYGFLGADPELRMTGSGMAVLKMRLATTEYGGKDKQEHTEWHSCTVFGKQADGLSKILRKGQGLIVLGKLRTNSWEDKDGNKRYRTEVICDDVIVTGKGGREQSEQDEPEDDLPF